jgi:hypothetical protein
MKTRDLDLISDAEKRSTCALARQYKTCGMGARLERPAMYNDDRHHACNEKLPAITFIDPRHLPPEVETIF